MAGDTIITIVGNLTADPELRFTQSGAAVTNFTIASTPRVYDRQTGEWKDGDPLFLRASLWREYAENAAQSLTKGCRVIAQGKLKQRSYETRDGEKRTTFELDIEEIGPALRYATTQITRTSRNHQPPATPPTTTPPTQATTATTTAPHPWEEFTDEPPF